MLKNLIVKGVLFSYEWKACCNHPIDEFFLCI